MDLDQLTAILADALATIVPAGFRVEAAGGVLWYSVEGDGDFDRAGTHVRRQLRWNR
jgi:hypothetical protein